jgi:Tol biopolymer transport system component
MPLQVGSRLGHYDVTALIGEGGMGQVYQATDTKLNRQVALKILPADTAADPERLKRFQREAQAIAALNHPNVVTIYSVEKVDATHFFTMELVEGKTLVELIPPGGLQLKELLAVALPLTDALSAAHERRIVHRDLKPANVMMGDDGRLKVLDFGLAKLRSELSAPSDAETASTLFTAPHRVLGTAAYMSPEQAEGKPADARSDIFSLGVVLFEMATGTRPFAGDSPAATISSILRDAPPSLKEIRPDLPEDVDRVVRRCLAKEPALRFHAASALRSELMDLQEQVARTETPPVTVASVPSASPGRRRRTAAAVGAGAVVLGVAFWLVIGSRQTSPQLPANFNQLTSNPGIEWFPDLAPDGQWIVFAGDAAGNRDIYLQSVTGQTPINLTADSADDEDHPSFSPDGERIAFRSNRDGGGIFVMGRTGEAVRRVTPEGFNPAWSPDSTRIVYASISQELRPANTEGFGELWVVSATGGDSMLLCGCDATLPHWSPNGHRIAFGQLLGAVRQANVVTIPAEGGEPVAVTADSDVSWNPVWAPDGRHLYYVSNRGGSTNVWRVAIDEATGRVLGEPEPLTTPAPFAAHLTISADGQRLAYSSVQETQNVFRLGLDPATGEAQGDPVPVTRGTRFWSNPDPSPDGQSVVFYSQVQPEGDLYVIRTDGTGLRQVTSDAATDRVPRWSPDGEWIVSFSDRSGDFQVWKSRVDGSELQQVRGDLGEGTVSAWSPDGTRLAVTTAVDPGATTGNALIMEAHNADADVVSLPPAPPPDSRFVPNSWSPDGRWLAGQNWYDILGVLVYDLETRTFDRVTEFGQWPVWFPDSLRLLIVSEGREFHLVDMRTRTTTRIFSALRDTLGPPRLTRDGRNAFFSLRATESDVWTATLE